MHIPRKVAFARVWAACIFACVVTPGLSFALPTLETVETTVDDARLVLSARTEYITGDTQSECTVRLVVDGEGVAIGEGDRAVVRVYENDFIGDDAYWSTEFEFSPREISEQQSDRVFDCSGQFPGDGNDEIELVATAEVQKGSCGFFCVWDRPTTPEIVMTDVGDDAAEQDDAVDQATPLPLGLTEGRVGIDQDFFEFELVGPTRVLFQAEHVASVGRLEVSLFGSDGESRVGEGMNEDQATVLDAPFLDRGTYYVRVTPREGDNFNFYDVRFAVAPVQQDCSPGTEEEESCGNCGVRVRSCDAMGSWGMFGPCEQEGICSPGESRTQTCGLCGERTETCDDTCNWGDAGPCEDEGECLPGDIDTLPCDGNPEMESIRDCDDACTWGPFSSCEGAACEEGEEESCYSGPSGTEGLGACRAGIRVCAEGVWGPCEGEKLPTEEQCADNIDNDCNGATDDEDAVCGGGATIGEPCMGTPDCARPFECVGPAEHPMFVDGYCGLTGCDSDCGPEAACVRVFGLPYCLKRCDRLDDCREGYLCSPIGASRVCVPRCTADVHCRDAARPFCDLNTGRCAEAPGAELPDAGVTPDAFMQPPRPDAGRIMPDEGVVPGDDVAVPAACECRAGSGGQPPWLWWGILALGGVITRRPSRGSSRQLRPRGPSSPRRRGPRGWFLRG
ncbi:MAG: hypothetical protein ACE366_29445 [Bradymonadia bacterium]